MFSRGVLRCSTVWSISFRTVYNNSVLSLLSHIRKGETEMASDLYRKIRNENGQQSDKFLFPSIMPTLVKSGDQELLDQVVSNMRGEQIVSLFLKEKNEMSFSAIQRNRILLSLVSARKQSTFLDFITAFGTPTQILNELLFEIALRGQDDKCKRAMKYAATARLNDITNYVSMAYGYLSGNHTKEAKDVVCEGVRIRNSPLFQKIVVKILRQAKYKAKLAETAHEKQYAMEIAEQLVPLAKLPIAFKEAMGVSKACDFPDVIPVWFSRMKEMKIIHTSETYGFLMWALAKNKSVEAVIQTLHTYGPNFTLEMKLFSTLIGEFISRGQTESAENLLHYEKNNEITQSHLNSLITGYIAENNITAAITLLRDMEYLYCIRPSQESFFPIVKYYIEHNKPVKAEQMFTFMRIEAPPTTACLYNMLIDSFFKMDNIKKATEYLNLLDSDKIPKDERTLVLSMKCILKSNITCTD